MPATFFPAPTTTLAFAGTGAAGDLAWILITAIVALADIWQARRRQTPSPADLPSSDGGTWEGR